MKEAIRSSSSTSRTRTASALVLRHLGIVSQNVAPSPRSVVDPGAATVRLRDRPHHAEPDPRARGASAVPEAREHVFLRRPPGRLPLRPPPRTATHRRSGTTRSVTGVAALRVHAGVVEQVEQRLPQSHRVSDHDRAVGDALDPQSAVEQRAGPSARRPTPRPAASSASGRSDDGSSPRASTARSSISRDIASSSSRTRSVVSLDPVRRRVVAKDLEVAADDRDRRPELVGDRRHERRLHPVEVLEPPRRSALLLELLLGPRQSRSVPTRASRRPSRRRPS